MQVWIKPNGEMPFLYGNHVLKAHLGRITEDTPEHQGVVVFSMNDIPLVRRERCPSSSAGPNPPTGIRCDCSLNNRYSQTGSHCNHRVPPSVRVIYLYILAIC